MTARKILGFFLAVSMIAAPGMSWSECSYIRWEEADFPPSSGNVAAEYISVENDYTGFGYWIYPYGPQTRFISVNVRSYTTEEGAEAWFGRLKNDAYFYGNPGYAYLGRVVELEDTVLEEVHAFRFVFGNCAPNDSYCQSNNGEESYVLIGCYKGNTVLEVNTAFNWHEPLVVPESLHINAYRELKRIIDRKCPSYRLQPFEATLTPGQSVTFTVFDGQGIQVPAADIIWQVVGVKSVSPFIEAKNANIGNVAPQGMFSATGIGTCQVRAKVKDGEAVSAPVSVVCDDRPGNIAYVLNAYNNRLPESAFRRDLEDGSVPSPYHLLPPGFANNMLSDGDPRYGASTCGSYQGEVLKLLHQIQADPDNCHNLNGYDFGPIQGWYGGHHAVVIFPQGTNWKQSGTVLDPWLNQEPTQYSIFEWSGYFPPASGDTSDAYRGNYGTTQDPSDYDWDLFDAASGLVDDVGQIVGALNCPVSLLIKDSQGNRTGALQDGAMLFEIEGAYVLRIADGAGGYHWYYSLPKTGGPFAMEIIGTAAGHFEMISSDPVNAGVGHYYASHPIAAGEKATVMVSSGESPGSLNFQNAPSVTPITVAQQVGCWLVEPDLDIPIPRVRFAGSNFTFRLKYSHSLNWDLDLSTLGLTGSGFGIDVGTDLNIVFPCVEFLGARYSFTMRYVHDLIWEFDLSTFAVH